VTPVAFLLFLLAAPEGGGTGQVFSLDLADTRARVTGGVRRFVAAGPDSGTLTVQLRGSTWGDARKWGELLFDLRRTPIARAAWGNRSTVEAQVRVSPEFVGDGRRNWARSHRARLFLADSRGRRLYLPHAPIVDRPPSSDGWLDLRGQPTVDVPMPLGIVDRGFDPAGVTGLGLNVEAFNREGETVTGTVELRRLRVSFGDQVPARILPPDPEIVAAEGARAAAMSARMAERLGLGAGQMAVGVNLAWPTARSPTGEEMQLYGRILDGANPWHNRLWDLGEEAVATSVRADFRGVRETFGPGAVVRLWLFADLRTGLTLDAEGDPVAVSERARGNMRVLLRLAAEEEVVLIPVLLDFHLADGVVRSGPNGAWQVNDRPDLVTDPRKRAKLVAALEAFVRPFAGDPSILAWDVMNEPENAAAVATPAHYADLQTLMRELVDAVHRAGDLATIGHRNAVDPARFFRGRAATDLGQAHYYPFVDTRPNPTPFHIRLTPAFGPLPAGWGELQARPSRIAAQLTAAHRAGHRLFLFWSWRGHQETGDGYAVQPHAAEIRRAVNQLRRTFPAPTRTPAAQR
jgi:hypothetical protein